MGFLVLISAFSCFTGILYLVWTLGPKDYDSSVSDGHFQIPPSIDQLKFAAEYFSRYKLVTLFSLFEFHVLDELQLEKSELLHPANFKHFSYFWLNEVRESSLWILPDIIFALKIIILQIRG